MTPSKENCLEALAALARLRASLNIGPIYRDAQFIGDFLASAAKRLPREAALAKDRQRKRTAKPRV